MPTLPDILPTDRGHKQTEREKGTNFEKLTRTFFQNESILHAPRSRTAEVAPSQR